VDLISNRTCANLPPLNGRGDHMSGAYLGPAFVQADIEQRLSAVGAKFDLLSDDDASAYIAL
jgi:carbamoyltransferase